MPADPPVLELPLSVDLLTMDRAVLGRLFRVERRGPREGEISPRLLFGTALYHLARRVEAGLEPPPRTNVRGLWYTVGRPLVVATGAELLDPYASFVRALTALVTEHRLIDYASLDVTDENWENRRIGGSYPGVVVFGEKEGQIRLLRAIHAEFGVSVQALRGMPSATTSSYLASHVGSALEVPAPVELVGVTDYDPRGHLIARAFRAQLAGFGLVVSGLHLVVGPELFTERELGTHAVEVPESPRDAHERRLARHHRRRERPTAGPGAGLTGLAPASGGHPERHARGHTPDRHGVSPTLLGPAAVECL